jgi:hypothetical protein
MTQKPMLRAEVYARALRASQNRKEDRARSNSPIQVHHSRIQVRYISAVGVWGILTST